MEHTIQSNNIINENDGYIITNKLIIVFHVIYPKKLDTSIINQLKKINF